MAQHEYTSFVYKLCCLCLNHVMPKLPVVFFGSVEKNSVKVDLSNAKGPLRSFVE